MFRAVSRTVSETSGDTLRGNCRAPDALDCWTAPNMLYTVHNMSYFVWPSLMRMTHDRHTLRTKFFRCALGRSGKEVRRGGGSNKSFGSANDDPGIRMTPKTQEGNCNKQEEKKKKRVWKDEEEPQMRKCHEERARKKCELRSRFFFFSVFLNPLFFFFLPFPVGFVGVPCKGLLVGGGGGRRRSF